MANIENLKPFVNGDDPRRNIKGRFEGSKNRSTIARKILEMKALYKDDALEELQKQYPEITKDTTVEEMMTIIQVDRAIKDQDPVSYKALLDSAYGAPKQEVDHTTGGDKINNKIEVEIIQPKEVD